MKARNFASPTPKRIIKRSKRADYIIFL